MTSEPVPVHHYRACGLELASARPLELLRPEGAGEGGAGGPRVLLEWTRGPAEPPGEGFERLPGSGAPSAASLHRGPDGALLLRLPDFAEARLAPDPPGRPGSLPGGRIRLVATWGFPESAPGSPGAERDRSLARSLELLLLGPVLTLWLEAAGRPCLHGSVVVRQAGGDEPRAVAFVGAKGSGKSSLALALALRPGFALMADDGVILEPSGLEGGEDGQDGQDGEAPVRVRSTHPHGRLWPDTARALLGARGDELPTVVVPDGWLEIEAGEGEASFREADLKRRLLAGEGSPVAFRRGVAPLGVLILPERGTDPEGALRWSRLSPREALVELLGHASLRRLAGAFDPGRFDALARVVSRVPVHRLVYPPGWDRLPEVTESLVGEMGEELSWSP